MSRPTGPVRDNTLPRRHLPRHRDAYAEVLRKLKSDERFVWIARGVAFERSDAVDNLRLPGIGAYREQMRFYPDLNGAHVLGFTGRDNQGWGPRGPFREDPGGQGGASPSSSATRMAAGVGAPRPSRPATA
jgi:hypothetical protein